MNKKSKNKKIFVLALLLVSAAAASLFFTEGNTFEIAGDGNRGDDAAVTEEQKAEETVPEGDKSPLSGLICDNAKARPIAVSLSGDKEARPLSGISQADLVIEMPAVTGGITRYLAFFVCSQPEEIGSVRSARHDHIPLAMGFDAVFAHWGGSHFALEKLDKGVMDNINALYLEGSVFYRKLGMYAPHNGFTSYERLKNYSQTRNYRSDSTLEGLRFASEQTTTGLKGRVTIGYPSSFKVEYEYDPVRNEYLRYKGGTREMDKNTNSQVAAKNVVIMYAASRQIEGQYNDMDIEGEGKAVVYRGGEEITGKWSKDKSSLSSQLRFYDKDGKEIEFFPGQTWIQVVQTDQSVDWTSGY